MTKIIRCDFQIFFLNSIFHSGYGFTKNMSEFVGEVVKLQGGQILINLTAKSFCWWLINFSFNSFCGFSEIDHVLRHLETTWSALVF